MSIGKEQSYNRPLLLDFFHWYYLVAPKKIVEIWGNYLLANLRYYSIGLLVRTLFAHWHRDVEDYGRGFDFSRYLRVFTLNLISRGVGFVVRSVTILVGLLTELFIFVFGLLFLAFWLVAPLGVTASLAFGIGLLT